MSEMFEAVGEGTYEVASDTYVPTVSYDSTAGDAERHRSKAIAVTVTITTTDDEGWRSTTQVPTFYLHPHVQGITTPEGARKVALQIVDRMGYLRGEHNADVMVYADQVDWD